MKKNFDQIIGTFIGGVSGYIGSSVYIDWIKPMLLSALCALIGLLVSHFGKKLLKKFNL